LTKASNQAPLKTISERTALDLVGGISVSEAQEVKQLRDGNARLKRIVAELTFDKDALPAVLRKSGWSLQQ
jgi:hypothetical protein